MRTELYTILHNIAPHRVTIEVPFDGSTGLKKITNGRWNWLNKCYVQRIRQATPASVLVPSFAGSNRQQELPAAGYLQVQWENISIIDNKPITGAQWDVDASAFTPTLPHRIDVLNSGILVMDATNTTSNGCFNFEVDYYPESWTASIAEMLGDNYCQLSEMALSSQLQSPYYRLESLPYTAVAMEQQTFGSSDYYNDKYVGGMYMPLLTGAGAALALSPSGRVPYLPLSGGVDIMRYGSNEPTWKDVPASSAYNTLQQTYPFAAKRTPVRISWESSIFRVYDTTGIPSNACLLLGVAYWPSEMTAAIDAQLRKLSC